MLGETETLQVAAARKIKMGPTEPNSEEYIVVRANENALRGTMTREGIKEENSEFSSQYERRCPTEYQRT